MTCNFRFEVRPDDEIVELEADHHIVRVCVDCLTLLTVHRRIHHMKVEKVIVEMSERGPLIRGSGGRLPAALTVVASFRFASRAFA